MARGTLRIYLGAAPGVGKTFDMLNEGRRRAERGTDVVIGLVETHGRPKTLEQIGGLEIVPRREVEYRGTVLEEMDLDAVLARAPAVALVDELAHTNAPGSRHAKRWEDIEELLDAGIDVISTVNIQHLESLNDVVEGITRPSASMPRSATTSGKGTSPPSVSSRCCGSPIGSTRRSPSIGCVTASRARGRRASA